MAASARFFLLVILLLPCSPRPQGQRPEIPQPGAERGRERRPGLPAKSPSQPCQGGTLQVPDHAAPLPVNRAPRGWGVHLNAVVDLKGRTFVMRWVGEERPPSPQPSPARERESVRSRGVSAGAPGGRATVWANGTGTVRPRVAREFLGDDRSGVGGGETRRFIHCLK